MAKSQWFVEWHIGIILVDVVVSTTCILLSQQCVFVWKMKVEGIGPIPLLVVDLFPAL
jgi:hypothetical protein